MTCNKSTMLKAALVLGILSIALYAALPGFRTLIVTFSPILLSLICPLTMLFCMLGMRQSAAQGQKCSSTADAPSKPNA